MWNFPDRNKPSNEEALVFLSGMLSIFSSFILAMNAWWTTSRDPHFKPRSGFSGDKNT
jgi:hypothetical protein